MTTALAAAVYAAEHAASISGRKVAVFNPHDKPVDSLPIIYGFNNGQMPTFGGVYENWDAQLVSEDGVRLGAHTCSSENYMLSDLGILEGTAEWRHKGFRERYPEGYRMAFVSYWDVPSHVGLSQALDALQKREPA